MNNSRIKFIIGFVILVTIFCLGIHVVISVIYKNKNRVQILVPIETKEVTNRFFVNQETSNCYILTDSKTGKKYLSFNHGIIEIKP